MKKISVLFVAAIVCAFVLSGFSTDARNIKIAEKFAVGANISQDEAPSGVYNFDKAHTSIGFNVKHMGLVNVPGYFRDFTGTVNYDPKDVSKSSVEFTAKMTSIDTGVGKRDEHLRSADFFEVEKYPDMTFKSTKVEKRGKDLTVTGDLTMKGITKQISFPAQITGFIKDQRGGTRAGVTAEATINRRDFGVNYGGNLPNGAQMISDQVQVILNIEAILPAPPAPKAE